MSGVGLRKTNQINPIAIASALKKLGSVFSRPQLGLFIHAKAGKRGFSAAKWRVELGLLRLGAKKPLH